MNQSTTQTAIVEQANEWQDGAPFSSADVKATFDFWWLKYRNLNPTPLVTTSGAWLTPMPSRNRLFDSACRVSAVIAVQAGVRACICMMPVPALMRVVRARIQAVGVTASVP